MKNKTSIMLFICPVECKYKICLIDKSEIFVGKLRYDSKYCGNATIILTMDNTPITLYKIVGKTLSKKIYKTTTLKNLAKNIELFNGESTKEFSDMFPLTLTVSDEGYLKTYSSVLFQDNTALFIRSNWKSTATVEFGPKIDNLNLSFSNHYSNILPLNNHNSFYTKWDSDNEIEYKMNFQVGTNIYYLATHFLNTVRKGKFRNYVLQYLDNFNMWEFDNHLFEVTEPQKEKGYISFISCPNDEYIVKRKIFDKDQLSRPEFRKRNVKLTKPMDAYLRENYPQITTFHKLPSFRRIRYDVNIESLRTGNIYSIMFDHSTIANQSVPPLIQCEIEYMKSRTITEPNNVMEELNEVFNFTKLELKDLKISFEETFLSKLSYLKKYENSK